MASKQTGSYLTWEPDLSEQTVFAKRYRTICGTNLNKNQTG